MRVTDLNLAPYATPPEVPNPAAAAVSYATPATATPFIAQELLDDAQWRKQNSRWGLWPWFSAFFFGGTMGWIGFLLAARRSDLPQLWRYFWGVLALNLLPPFLPAILFGSQLFSDAAIGALTGLAFTASIVGSIVLAGKAKRIYLPWKAQQEAAGLPDHTEWWHNAVLPVEVLPSAGPAQIGPVKYDLAGQAATTVIELDRIAVEADQKANFAYAADDPDAQRLRWLADTHRNRATEASRLNNLAAGLAPGSAEQQDHYLRIIRFVGTPVEPERAA